MGLIYMHEGQALSNPTVTYVWQRPRIGCLTLPPYGSAMSPSRWLSDGSLMVPFCILVPATVGTSR